MANINNQTLVSKYQILNALDSHIEGLVKIYNSWENNPFIKIDGDPSAFFKMCITQGDLPPIEDACKDNYQLYTVICNDQIIGYFDMYKGYPNQDSIWISIFVIDSHVSYQGHGINVFKLFENQLIDKKHKTLSLGVKHHNIKALKFWVKLGFNQIIGIYGNDDITIGLKKPITDHT